MKLDMITSYDDDMRTIVDLPEEQLDGLAEICRREGISRAEAVRRAVAAFLQDLAPIAVDDAFGLWRDRGFDGLEYERRLRVEW